MTNRERELLEDPVGVFDDLEITMAPDAIPAQDEMTPIEKGVKMHPFILERGSKRLQKGGQK